MGGLVHADGDGAGGRLEGGIGVGLAKAVLGLNVLNEASIACVQTEVSHIQKYKNLTVRRRWAGQLPFLVQPTYLGCA